MFPHMLDQTNMVLNMRDITIGTNLIPLGPYQQRANIKISFSLVLFFFLSTFLLFFFLFLFIYSFIHFLFPSPHSRKSPLFSFFFFFRKHNESKISYYFSGFLLHNEIITLLCKKIVTQRFIVIPFFKMYKRSWILMHSVQLYLNFVVHFLRKKCTTDV